MGQKFEKTAGKKIKPSKNVRLKRMQNVIEITSIEKSTGGLDQIRKLSKTEYLVVETGEIKEYSLSENKSQNIASLKKTFRHIRDLINNSFRGAGNEKHITLTYRQENGEPMTDLDRLYRDFKKFWKKFKRRYGDDVDYLSVVEPHQSGQWHCHVLVRFNGCEQMYLPNSEIEELWGQGFTKTRATDKVDNMGAYLTAYLTDVELTSENSVKAHVEGSELKVIEVEGQTKAFIKGGRVHYYPSGMNIVRHSRGIKPPDIEEMTYKQAKKIVGDTTPNYSTTTIIYGDDDQKLNQITYEQYNLKRIKE